jgi:hypothetical protein
MTPQPVRHRRGIRRLAAIVTIAASAVLLAGCDGTITIPPGLPTTLPPSAFLTPKYASAPSTVQLPSQLQLRYLRAAAICSAPSCSSPRQIEPG